MTLVHLTLFALVPAILAVAIVCRARAWAWQARFIATFQAATSRVVSTWPQQRLDALVTPCLRACRLTNTYMTASAVLAWLSAIVSFAGLCIILVGRFA